VKKKKMKTEIKEETEKQSSFGKAFLSKKRFVPAILIAFVLMVSIMAVPAMAARGVPQEPGSLLMSTPGMEILWEYFVADSWPTAIRLPNGNTLFDDYGNNRVIEVTPGKDIVWECNATTTGLLAPWIAFRLSNGNTLIPDTGNDRVIEVEPDCTIVWECNATTSGLDDPEWAQRLSTGNTLIADYGNDRVIEVEPDCTIVWECNAITTGLSGPDSVERLSNGNTLVADYGNDRVIEVEPDCTIVWECNAITTGISLPTSIQRLPTGNTLISECGNDRAIEVASDCTIVWEVNASTHGIACPYNAQRLPNGNTMIGDTDNCRAIEVGTPAEPDLIVEKSVEFEDGKFVVSYTVTNIGDDDAGESTMCKYVDGELQETKDCPALAPGESHSGTFDPEPCPCGETLNVTVCADNDDVVAESDETNNCVVNIVECPAIPVDIDVKPGSCPNPLNLKSKGVLPVAVLGTAEFDVTTIDPGTILLTREGCEGVAAIRWSYEDVATPFTGELCDCNDLNGDSYIDLTLVFDTQELVSNLKLDNVAGETIPLTVTGNLNAENDGTPIEGKDCIRVQ
jgi:hypothetical protein